MIKTQTFSHRLLPILTWGGVLLLAFFLRWYQVTSSPPAPYWEEVALGYDAYSILETGKDHHGNAWPLVAFESFGDWKPSGYFYALVPFIKLFGLNVLAVRLPSILAGVAIVAGMGFLMRFFAQSVGKSQSQVRNLEFWALFLAAVNPWLIQFSRGGWEANLATAFILWGVIFGLWSIRGEKTRIKRFGQFTISIMWLFLAVYSYHSARILAPALGLTLALFFLQKDWLEGQKKKLAFWRVKNLIAYLVPLFLVLTLSAPLLASFSRPELTQRFAETSIFSDLSVIEQSNTLRAEFGNSLWARVVYHRYVLFAGKIAHQAFSHFTIDFLFLNGDANPRHGSQFFGLFYPFEIIFLAIGAYGFIKLLSRKRKTKQQFDSRLFCTLLSVWLLFGVLPAALTKTVPHALRILPTAPVFIVLGALGVVNFVDWLAPFFQPLLKKFSKAIVFKSLVLGYLLSVFFLFQHLLKIYPQQYGADWMVGYEEKIHQIHEQVLENPTEIITVSRKMGRPAMYYWFYTVTDPREVQALDDIVLKDQGEFLEFKNLRFGP